MKKETDLLKSIFSFFLLISFVLYSDDACCFMIYLPLDLKKQLTETNADFWT